LIGGSSKGSIEGSIGISQFPKAHQVLQRRNGGNVPRQPCCRRTGSVSLRVLLASV
jgi:hypothetical protein